MKKLIICCCTLLLLANVSFAQEKLYLKTQKEPIECQIVEINTEEVKYKPSDAPQLIIGVIKSDVLKIVYQSGRTQIITDPLEDYSFYVGQKRFIAKAGVLSPLNGFTDLYLEKSIKPGRSFEIQANIIGLGNKRHASDGFTVSDSLFMKQKGLALGIGYKVLRMPDFTLSNRRLTHILQGSYIKPNVLFGYYQRNFLYQDPNSNLYKTQNKGVAYAQLGINLGKQWIFDNTFSIEIFGSLGIGFDNYRSQQIKSIVENGGTNYINQNVIPYGNFGFTRFGSNNMGLTLGGGIKVGYLFNWKKSKDSIGGVNRMKARLK
jgi:hypothetical protein